MSKQGAAGNDPVIVGAYRSPMCRSYRGRLSEMSTEGILYQTMAGSLKRAGVGPHLIEEVVVGNALREGTISASSRMACLRAGIPVESTTLVVNRQCASGLEAISLIAEAIRTGRISCGIGAGVESMSQWYPQEMRKPDPRVLGSEEARDCLLSMGETSENVSKEFGVGRKEQDAFALESQRKARAARERGAFGKEIIPILLEDGGYATEDEGIRESTMEGLGRLKGAFGEGSSSTAGNSSQISDGAAVVILMSRSKALEHGLEILAEFVSYRVVGVPPRIMGVGPTKAIPKLLEAAGMDLEDVDLFEINEAFASQCLYCIRALGIPTEKVNLNGGAIALGHPLGATGARVVVSLVNLLRERGARVGVASMCVGSGFGAAALIRTEWEREAYIS
jgi:acetyl-CoA acyltransferase 1